MQAYLQELLMNTECTRTTIYMNQSADPTLAAETDIDMQAASGDTVHMQPSTSLTNTAIQVQRCTVTLFTHGHCKVFAKIIHTSLARVERTFQFTLVLWP